MAYPRKNLNEDEEVVLDLNPHWWQLARPAATLGLSLVVGIVGLASDWPLFVAWVVRLGILAAIGWFVVSYLVWSSTNFVVTSDRLIFRTGVLSKHGIEIPLERVNNVIFHQSLFERMLGAGDLLIESAGESGQQSFSDIVNPDNVQNTIYRQIEANEERTARRVATAHAEATRAEAAAGDPQQAATPPPATPASQAPLPSSASIPDQIAQLADLVDRGVLSHEEFEAKKRDLLDRM